MIIAIYAASEKTTFTIETAEELYLEQMGLPDKRVKLNPGANKIVIGAGVFKVRSKTAVRVTPDAVTADPSQFQIHVIPNDKDGGPIDPPKLLMPHLDSKALTGFLLDAKGMPPQL